MAREIVINWEPHRSIVTSLAKSGTRFLVIGSTAFRFYVPDRQEPNDLDLVIEPSIAALDSFNAAAAPHGFGGVRLTPEDLAKPNAMFRAKTYSLDVDVFVTSEGFEFEELWQTAEPAMMSGSDTTVRVASIATLDRWLTRAIAMEPSRAGTIRQDLDLLRRAASGR